VINLCAKQLSRLAFDHPDLINRRQKSDGRAGFSAWPPCAFICGTQDIQPRVKSKKRKLGRVFLGKYEMQSCLPPVF